MRDSSLNRNCHFPRTFFFCFWQQSFCSCCCYCSAQTSLKKRQPHKAPVLSSCSSQKQTAASVFTSACGTRFMSNASFFSLSLCCCRAGQAAALARAQPPPTSHPPISLTKLWLSSSLIRSWTSPSPPSTTDPFSPAPPAGRRFVSIKEQKGLWKIFLLNYFQSLSDGSIWMYWNSLTKGSWHLPASECWVDSPTDQRHEY